jgi:uncharacterized cupredoxin-like copper-binding protein
MAAYYVLGILLVVWALGLSAAGLTRADFPPTGNAGRAIVGATVVIVAGTLIALLVTTDKEHPREEAAAKAAEEKQASEGAPGAPTPGGPPPAGGAKTVKVSEKEFSIALASGNELKAGKYSFQVANVGKIQHDLAIEGGGIKESRTPLIDAGQSKDLQVDLKPGKYKFYCTVPGHAQSGMRVEVTVTGGPGGGAKRPAAKKPSAPPKAAAAKTVKVAEKEFSIALAGGSELKAGKYAFQVANVGKIQHDLAIEGNGIKETKTPLLNAGQSKDLQISLKPGKYKFFCTVPGHEQAGMKVDVTVR